MDKTIEIAQERTKQVSQIQTPQTIPKMMERESIYFPVPFDFMNSVPRGVNGDGWVRFYLSPSDISSTRRRSTVRLGCCSGRKQGNRMV